jgi:hypothetical protein
MVVLLYLQLQELKAANMRLQSQVTAASSARPQQQ